jgi:hypothetical protein
VRFSMLYALLDSSAVIDVPHLQSALAVWDYCNRSAAYLFATVSGDPQADKVAAALVAHHPGGLTFTTITHDLLHRHGSAEEVASVLIPQGLARRETEHPDGSGRPTSYLYATDKLLGQGGAR